MVYRQLELPPRSGDHVPHDGRDRARSQCILVFRVNEAPGLDRGSADVGATKKCTGGTKMTQMAELTTQVPARGRQTKFTPERIQQIKDLVEPGKSREEIAELIGVTLGSLQVTCSRLGVSLRRPTFNTGTGLLRRGEPAPNATAPHCLGAATAIGLS